MEIDKQMHMVAFPSKLHQATFPRRQQESKALPEKTQHLGIQSLATIFADKDQMYAQGEDSMVAMIVSHTSF